MVVSLMVDAGLDFRSRCHVLIRKHGHNYAAYLVALVAAKTAGLRILMRGETHLGLPRSRMKTTLRRPALGALYGLCDRLLAIGSANAAFYRAMGVPEHKIFLVPYSVDNDRFMKAAKLDASEGKCPQAIQYCRQTGRACFMRRSS